MTTVALTGYQGQSPWLIGLALGAVLLWGAPALAAAQHQHGAPADAAAACADRARQALVALDRAERALETARQENAPAALRQAADEAQLALAETRQQLVQCLEAGAPAEHDHGDHTDHSVHGQPAAAPADPAPHRHEAPAEAIDPVCGMKVDPQTAAATATHEGTTYYFCSVGDRDAYLKDPAKYIKKP